MWLAERDACSEARATIRMSRYSLYTAVRRRGGAPGRPLHRSAPPGSARSRSRAASARSASGRSSLQISVSGLISGPTAGCRRDDVARARRAYARGRNGRDACNGRVAGVGPAIAGCDGRSVGGGYGGLSPIPDSGYRKKKIHTQPHCASRRTTLFSPPVGMTSRVRRHPTAPRLVLKCLYLASSLSHLEPNRTSLASTVTPGILFSFLRNKRLASSLSP